MAMKVTGLLGLVLCVALALAEPRVQQRRGIATSAGIASPNHPYLFLSVPRGRSGAVVHGFEVLQDENDDDEDSADDAHHNDDEEDNDPMNDDEDDDESELMINLNRIAMPLQQNDDDDDNASQSEGEDSMDDEDAEHKGQTVVTAQQLLTNTKKNMQTIMRNAKPTHMMVSRENAGAIMVPDGIIEIEGQSVYDEKTGQTALLVPRDALDAVPNGSVVALMERPLDDETEEERANRVIVRRRSQASRRKLQRQGGTGKRRHGVRRGYNAIRRRVPSDNRRRNVRRQPTGGKRRRIRRPTIIQG